MERGKGQKFFMSLYDCEMHWKQVESSFQEFRDVTESGKECQQGRIQISVSKVFLMQFISKTKLYSEEG